MPAFTGQVFDVYYLQSAVVSLLRGVKDQSLVPLSLGNLCYFPSQGTVELSSLAPWTLYVYSAIMRKCVVFSFTACLL